MIDYSEKYIPNESEYIKSKINEILNHPLVTFDNYYWVKHRERPFNGDGGCIDLYEDNVENSVKGLTFIIRMLLKYSPKRILEIGTNSSSFSLISKLVLDEVDIYTVDREPNFKPRVDQINSYFKSNFIHMFIGDSSSDEFLEWSRQNSPYDFAWIDAKHDYPSVVNDIDVSINCKTPIIGCDDCGILIPTDVYKVVHKLQSEGNVSIIDETSIESSVGAICILKNNLL